MGHIYMQMVRNTMENGKMTNRMAMVKKLGLMELAMKDNIKMVKRMVKGNFILLMVKQILIGIKGSCYEGNFSENDINGFGLYIWPDSRKYEGEWYKNKMQGKGKTFWPDGRIYTGDYLDDKKHGDGIFEWADGRKYIGSWKNGKQHGKGVYVNNNNEEKDGEWQDGRRIKWMNESSKETNK